MKTIILTMLLAASCFACNSSFECGFGSACVKINGDYRPGVCMSGLNLNNGYGASQGLQAPDNGSYCTYDAQCGYGKSCVNGHCY